MPKTLLLEAGFLCLPDNLFATNLPDLREPVGQALRHEKLEFSRLRCWVSQHRIGILIEGLTDAQVDSVKEVRGPKASGSFDNNNVPSMAVHGFAAAQGVQYKDLITREVDGEKYLFAIRSVAGKPIEKSVARIKDAVFGSINFSLPAWSNSSLFPQPPIYFTAMIDDKVCEIELDGLKAKNLTASHDGLTIKYHVLSGAQFYPQVLQQLGVICDTTERRKVLETRIRSILPEGCLLRSEGARISHLCYYKESLQPLMLKFKPEYLEMPEAVLHRYMIKHFSLLACENNRGRMMPAAVAISEKSRPQSQEAVMRAAELDDHFARLMQLWRSDLETLPGRLAQLAGKFEKDKALTPEPGNLLARCAIWLIPRLALESSVVDINLLISLVAEGERTRIAALLPSTGFAVVVNCIGEIPVFKKLVPVLQEICDFFSGRLPAPGNVAGQVLCLALLMRNHVMSDSGELIEPSRIIALLRAVSFRLDIFQAFSDIFPEHNLVRRAWLQTVVAETFKESQPKLTGDSFLSSYEFDPASFYEALRSWKDLTAADVESISALFQRLRSKVEGGLACVEEISDCQIEKEIVVPLARLEKLPGVNYQEIFGFFSKEKVNIEACLMNLPPVLDDTNPEHASRINLLQRLLRQLGRLPFIVKEKVSGKK
ncbi:MAG: glycine--tRNA ligase subunit beta [Candidatus Riflebacteria bacterium]|nr:glycine--tRNA ligase subunit beta [Candidatus Riflebacteria bacterium]